MSVCVHADVAVYVEVCVHVWARVRSRQVCVQGDVSALRFYYLCVHVSVHSCAPTVDLPSSRKRLCSPACRVEGRPSRSQLDPGRRKASRPASSPDPLAPSLKSLVMACTRAGKNVRYAERAANREKKLKGKEMRLYNHMGKNYICKYPSNGRLVR